MKIESATPVPNFFIENYMLSANPTFSLIYIYLYKKYLCGHSDFSISNIAMDFNIIESDVINCLKYWQAKNLIEFDKLENIFSIHFICPKFISNSTKKFDAFPNYSMEELNLYKDNEKIKAMFDFVQISLGRYLTYSDLNIVFGMYDYLRLPLDVIHFLIDFCVQNGHRNLSYIEKVAIDWAIDKIDSVEKAQEKINGMNELFREVKKALGVTNLNAKQRELILNWNKKLNMPQDLIIEACNITMMNIGRPNFNYLLSIIDTWHRQGIKTCSQAQNYKLEINFETAPKINSGMKNKFANFKQRDWDFAKIEQLAQED